MYFIFVDFLENKIVCDSLWLVCRFKFLGNSVVLLVIAVNKTMHTTTNFFIASMALSDVIFIAFGVPLNIYVLQAEQGWKLGSVTCSLFWYLMYVSENPKIQLLCDIFTMQSTVQNYFEKT